MGFSQVLFELYAKGVVDAIANTVQDILEFGSLVHHCRILLRVTSGFKICYARQQANVVAHTKEKNRIYRPIYRRNIGYQLVPTRFFQPKEISQKSVKSPIFRLNIGNF